MDQNIEFFFHTGLGKTGSTYLQHKFFPKLKGLKYIKHTQYRDHIYVDIIKKSDNNRFLLSNEFDTQFQRELSDVCMMYPNAKIFFVIRRQDKWAASQYRRFIKNGKTMAFNEFLDLENDQGKWNQKEFYFYDKIKFVEEHFKEKPYVLLYDEFRESPIDFFDKIANFTNSTYQQEEIDLTPKHVSYNEKQLKVMRQYGSRFFSNDKKFAKNYWLRKLQTKLKMIGTHAILYLAPLVPKTWVSKEPLISKEELTAVKEFYKEDWNKCLDYINKQPF